MIRRYLKVLPVSIVAVACLAGSMASAGTIRFDDVSLGFGSQPGIIGYDADAGILYGIGIEFSDVEGFGTDDDGTKYTCVSCFLNFAVEATVDGNFEFTVANNPDPDSIEMEGEVAGVTFPVASSVTLISSVDGTTWNSTSGGQDNQGFNFTGRGFDLKNDDLVSNFFGAGAIGTEFAFSLQLQTPTGRIIGSPAGDPTEGDIDYYWNIIDAQMLNTPRVPEPATFALLLTGLSLVAFRRRKL